MGDHVMNVHLMTRGKDIDYGFVGAVSRTWWEDYATRKLASVEVWDDVAILAEGYEDGLRVHVTGLPSLRVDGHGRQIRWTVICDHVGLDDVPHVLGLVRQA